MANAMPAFQFYPRDFLADPAVFPMTAEEVGGYWLLLCQAWSSERPGYLPNDGEILAGLSRLGPRWLMCEKAIRRAFRATDDGQWLYSKRMVEEWDKLQAHRQQMSTAGKNGASIRWGGHSKAKAKPRRGQCHRNATAIANDSSSSALALASSEEIRQSTEETFVESAGADSAFDFESIYRAYPRKLGKAKGLQACKAQIKTQERYDELVKAVRNYAALVAAEGREQRYVKHFASFMACWTDYLDIEPPAAAQPVLPIGRGPITPRPPIAVTREVKL